METSTTTTIMAKSDGQEAPLSQESMAKERLVFSGQAILMGPACGKTTFATKYPRKFIDAEEYFDFRIALHDSLYQPVPSSSDLVKPEHANHHARLWTSTCSLYYNPHNLSKLLYTSNWEALADFNAFWFRAVFPVLLALLHTGRTVLFNAVSPANVFAARLCIDGLNQMQENVVSVYRLTAESLEKHMAKRREQHQGCSYRVDRGPLKYQHHNFAWAQTNHTLIHGLASECQLANVSYQDLDALTETQTSFDGDKKCIRFQVSEQTFRLLEILPLCWALFDDTQQDLHAFCGMYRSVDSKSPTTVLYLDPYTGRRARYTSIRFTKSQLYLCVGFKDPTNCAVVDTGKLADDQDDVSSLLDWTRFDEARAAPEPTFTNEDFRPCVIVYFGTFAPFHSGHLETVELAKRHLEETGWTVLGAHLTPSSIIPDKKEEQIRGLDDWSTRAAIAELCTAHVDWIKVDFAGGKPDECVEARLPHVPKNTTIIWVNGTDVGVSERILKKLEECKKRNNGHQNVKLLFVPRKTTPRPLCGRALSHDEICRFQAELNYSSTQVRKMIRERQFEAAAKIIGNKAAAAYCIWAHQEGEFTKSDNEISAQVIEAYCKTSAFVARGDADKV